MARVISTTKLEKLTVWTSLSCERKIDRSY
jgi:hypothetical protein